MAKNIIAFEDLKLNNTFDGVACIKSATIQKTKTQKDYVSGTVIRGKLTFQFKIWDSAVVAILRPFIEAPTGFRAHLAEVTGTVGQYNGSLDYTFSSVTPIPDTDEVAVKDFLPSLDCERLFNQLCEFINTKLSPNYINTLIAIMQLPANGDPTATGTIQTALKTCWAASGNHDAIAGGLINHTLKMLRYAEVMIADHPFFTEHKDLIYTGIILHDIGKTQEIVDGNYTKNSFVSHRIMGVEYLAMLKPTIVSLIGVEAYYRLMSVIEGHHDKFGNPADTVWAYIIHLIDMLDTWATMIEEAIVNEKALISNTGEKYLMRDGQRLYY